MNNTVINNTTINLLPLDVLYQSQTTTSAVGAIWMSHHKAFAQFIFQYNPSSALELGGAHGVLANEFHALANIPWTILEPNPSPTDDCHAHFIKGFFDDKFEFDSPFDAVIHSHVFEHLYEPSQFMKQLKSFIGESKLMIFSLPHLEAWLAKKYTNCINFEHSVFLTEPYVEYLLAKYGFRLLKKEYFNDGHSIFYATVKDSSVKSTELPLYLYEKNKKLYMDFVCYHEMLISDLNKMLEISTSPVYLFGAHVFAQYLIAFGLNTTNIVSLLDNDKRKQGRRLYGTNLMVQSPAVLLEDNSPVVILKAGVYNNEIKADILKNINNSTVFVE